YGEILADRLQQWQSLEREESKSYTTSSLIEASIKPWEIKAAVERNELAIHKLTLTPEGRVAFEEAIKNKGLSKPAHWYDANEVTEALKSHARELATLLLGAPNQRMSNTHELRF